MTVPAVKVTVPPSVAPAVRAWSRVTVCGLEVLLMCESI